MRSTDDQPAGERAIFAEFAAVAGLLVRSTSIESRPSPEPDIRCELEGEGPVAFELGEVVSEALERATNERVALRRNFCERYGALAPEDRGRIERCLGGPPTVFAGFLKSVPPGRWRQAVGPMITTLVDRAHATNPAERLREGEIPVWRIPALRKLLTDLEVQRGGGTPFLGVLDVTPLADATWRLLEKKFRKKYQTDAPIELLAYYVAAPPTREHRWRTEVLDFIRARGPRSPFRRVWLFDGFARAVVLVHPESGRL